MINSRGFRNAAMAAMCALLLTVGSVWASSSRRARGDRLLQTVPDGSLFCVRINNLDGTLDAADLFLKGVVPEIVDVKEMARSGLADFLGDQALKGVNTKGSFAIFGVNVPGESAKPGFMRNMFIGALIPVRNYDKFISGNPNCSGPDDEGISTITVDGREKGLVMRFRRFALLCPKKARDKMIRATKLMRTEKAGLLKALDKNEIELAKTSSVWLYVNVRQGSNLIGPKLFAQLEQMKTALKKMNDSGQGPMGDPAAIIGFYAGIFEMLMNGTEHIMIGLSPTSDVCNMTFAMKAVPGTEMAEMLAAPQGGDFRNLLPYLDDGAMMNLSCNINRRTLKKIYPKFIDLIGGITAGGVSEEDLEKLKKLATKGIDAMGDSLAFSLAGGCEDSVPFSAKYVIKISNKKAFEQVIEEQLQMMHDGAIADLYKALGLEMDIKVKRGVDTYKGIRIDSAKVAFRMGEEDSPQSRMIEGMFGDGLHYRWALVDDYCVYAIGGDTDKKIRRLIDQIRAEAPKEIGSEMKEALNIIPDSEQADLVGTLNYVRMLNMVSAFMSMPDGVNFPKLDVPTKSNIAFAGRSADGRLTFRIALPKQHLLEIKSAFEKFIPQIVQQQKQQRQKKRHEQKEQAISVDAEEAAVEAAEAWLGLVDSGKYSQSWDEAAEYIKALVSKEIWQNSIQGVRGPLGKVVSRELKSKRYTESVPGAPVGRYVIIQYKTSFENKESAIETVTPMLEKDGRWKVSGYYIK
jgi:hypothetical protein